MLKKILLIHTGGTMGMKYSVSSGLDSGNFSQEVFQHIPGVRDIAEVEFRSACSLDSSNITIHHWMELARIVEEGMDQYDGFVIIHGTDTMSYTASALSYLLTNLPKPVILTGSQRPLAAIRTDAKNNLINAIELATYPIPEVCVFFDYKLFRGNRTKKVSIDAFDAFKSPNFPSLADIGLHIEIRHVHRQPAGIFRLQGGFRDEVICLKLFPNMHPEWMELLLRSPVKVFILEAFGAGNVPNLDYSIIPFIRKATEAGKLVLIASQCIDGTVDLNLYECGQEAMAAGALSIRDMTVEAAIVKAMYLLEEFDGQIQKIRSQFHRSIAGEITEE